MTKIPLLAAAAVLQLLTRCGGSSTTAVTVPQLNTETYLDTALDANNLFHWTPRSDGQPVELHVIVHNGPGEIPAGLDAFAVGAGEVETFVTESVTMWAEASGVIFDLQIHGFGGSPAPSSDACTIEVHFRSTAGADLSGFAWLETRFLDPRTVSRVQVQISVPLQPAEVNLNTLRALVLHEFGHALGIVAPQPHTGHSPSSSDVMHPAVRWNRLSTADKTAIRELYAMEPNILRGDRSAGGPGAPGGPGGAADESFDFLRPVIAWSAARLRSPAPPLAPLRAEDPVFSGSGCRACR